MGDRFNFTSKLQRHLPLIYQNELELEQIHKDTVYAVLQKSNQYSEILHFGILAVLISVVLRAVF